MRKKLELIESLIAAGILVISLLPVPAEAAIKPGSACNKKGITQTFAGKKFTCIVKSNKLIWDSGVLIVKPAPATKLQSTPSPAPSPKPTIAKVYVAAANAEADLNCNTYDVVAFTLKGPVICKDEIWQIADRDSSVSAAAYWNVLDRWNSQPFSAAKLDLHIDPNAGDWTKTIEAGIQAGAKFWGTSNENSKVLPVFISNDNLYIERELVKAGIQQSEDSKKRNADAKGGQAGFNSDTGNHVIYLDFLFKEIGQTDDIGFIQVGPHEYTHFAQYTLGSPHWQMAGPWFIEGMASYIGTALTPMFGMPHHSMTIWNKQFSDTTLPLTAFLDYDSKITENPNWNNIYPMGAMASEALVALVGMDAVYNLSADLSKGLSLDETFKKNVGMTDATINKLLSDYLQTIKGGHGWSFGELKRRYLALKV